MGGSTDGQNNIVTHLKVDMYLSIKYIPLVSGTLLCMVVILALLINICFKRQMPALPRRHARRTFRVNPAIISRGLDRAVLSSLPIFTYSSKTCENAAVLECVICLSEFEENEMGRLLPKCNHSFHIECIEMWFACHSTCPVCRSSVDMSETIVMVDGLALISESVSTS